MSSETNPNSRLEAFCDGVFAFALTLLVVDIKIPSTPEIKTNADFWLALYTIIPSVFSFVLSFVIILITWVNHHGALKLITKSAPSFIYANGFLLLTVVFMPFPTSLLGEHLFTEHAAPAVILYDAVQALQALGWVFVITAALKNNLGKNDTAIKVGRQNRQFAYFAFVLYSLCAVVAIWFPVTVALFTALTWILWLVIGINMKHE